MKQGLVWALYAVAVLAVALGLAEVSSAVRWALIERGYLEVPDLYMRRADDGWVYDAPPDRPWADVLWEFAAGAALFGAAGGIVWAVRRGVLALLGRGGA